MLNKKRKSQTPTISTGGNNWKPPIFLYCLGFAFGLYISTVFAANYEKGDTFFTVFPRIKENLSEGIFNIELRAAVTPFKKFAATVFFVELIICMFIIVDITKNRDFMRGKEYGTARWISPDVINRKFADFQNPCANRVYSNSIRINMDAKKTRINNNTLVIGGSGVGKSLFLLTPNLYQANKDTVYPGSFVVTDPKGELLLQNGNLLREKGYVIKVLNLVPGMMHESDCFNPLAYIRSDTDIDALITNLQENTDPGNSAPSDPFWPKAEALFLKSLILIVWMESELFGWEKNFNQVFKLLDMVKISDDAEDVSDLDQVFYDLIEKTADDESKGPNHPAYIAYKSVMQGAADTKRCVYITCTTRVSRMRNDEITRILSKDELDLQSIGSGRPLGSKSGTLQKTALFCVIPDSDDTFNFLAGMMYTMLFKELYFYADYKTKKRELPVPVSFWLDEFANIALPKNFLRMLTTMRSRRISCIIIIQNLAQIKGKWKDEWEEIPGNCDVCVYLGGNEPSTFEYISKNLGKKTIFKKSYGESKGTHGSSSSNEDVIGRELMLPEEVRELDNDYCIIFVRGKKPVLDFKYRTFEDSNFEKSNQLGGYSHSQQKKTASDLHITFISKEEASSAINDGSILRINLDESIYESPGWSELQNLMISNAEEEREQLEKQKYYDIRNIDLFSLLQMDEFELTNDELFEVTEGVKNGLTDEQVKSYILFGDSNRMRATRMMLEAYNSRVIERSE